MFRNTGANAFAKNQMRVAYEDKRDLYCTCSFLANSVYGTNEHAYLLTIVTVGAKERFTV